MNNPNINLLSELKNRGLIAQISDESSLEKILSTHSIGIYCGFDPTADSLHLGHLLPLLCLRRFQLAGHRPFLLIGSATGMIGDPSFKETERKLNSTDTVKHYAEKLRTQAASFLEFESKDNSAIIVNNLDWFNSMKCIDFLRDIGKYFSVNAMINKESVKQRIQRDDTGISFTEFAYALLQSYDFVKLNEKYHVKLQIGGSDQWGNITSGIDLTRRINQQTTYGLTVPLVTKSDGSKFGKTEAGNIWLDPEKTTPYKFYQFWLNTPDADVYNFLYYFTFLADVDIQKIKSEDEASTGTPKAQKILATKVTELVHGKTALEKSVHITKNLFNNQLENLKESDFIQLAKDGMPSTQITSLDNLQEILVKSNLCSSKKKARALIVSNGIQINGNILNNTEYHFTNQDRLYGKYILIRRGKKNYHLAICEQ